MQHPNIKIDWSQCFTDIGIRHGKIWAKPTPLFENIWTSSLGGRLRKRGWRKANGYIIAPERLTEALMDRLGTDTEASEFNVSMQIGDAP